MPIQNSPPARQTRSQARTQGVLTPTLTSPLYGTTAVSQLRAPHGRRSTMQEGRKRAKEIELILRSEDGEEEENSVEEEESDGTEGALAPLGASQGTGGATLAQSDQQVSHQSEPSLLAIMKQTTQIMPNIQEASSSESSRQPAFKTPSMKALEFLNGTQPFKFRSFIQSCQLIFHNYPANFSQGRKKFLYATSFLICRASKWIEPYLSNLTNQDSHYLLNSWNLLKSQLFTLFGTQMKLGKLKQNWIL
ncbi:hypothetical protein O181_064717 [Austropuccinia psidii MF-1]|uniref:DUF4939 domain-containing protein n=1 Tax=Austropuccinia psidii MF-1 TaxID=1389203 RepID=A0A9Q3EW88_9BASI|nr:hypothetical protein [Austropuccinia psidii MF-1]